MVVKQQSEKLGLHYSIVGLGGAEILEKISPVQKEEFKAGLIRYGLELPDDKKSLLIEKIKKVIVEFIHYTDEPLKVNFSDHLSEK